MGKAKDVYLILGKKKIGLKAIEMKGIMRGIGLMLRTNDTRSLLFNFNRPSRVTITSVFVFFSFLAVWTDRRGRVIETKMVRPFTFSVTPGRKAARLIEIPLNSRNRRLIRFLTK